MELYHSARRALGLLDSADRQRFFLILLAQIASSVLDLAGVLLFGVVTVLGTAGLQGAPLPAPIESLLEIVGLAEADITTTIALLGSVAAALFVLKSVVAIWLSRATLHLLAKASTNITGRLTDGLLQLPVLDLQEKPSQNRVYALTVAMLSGVMTGLNVVSILLSEVAVLAVLAVVLFVVNPVITTVTAAYFVLIAILLQRYVGGRSATAGLLQSRADVASFAAIQDAISTYRELSVSNRRHFYGDRIQALRSEALFANAEMQFLANSPRFVFEAALILGTVALIASQVMTATSLEEAVGTLAVFLAAGARALPSMLRASVAVTSLRAALGLAENTFNLDDELTNGGARSADRTGTVARARLLATPAKQESASRVGTPSLQVRSVSLRYPRSTFDALDNITLELEPGGSLALVGPSGGGKSTLADAILGVIQPQAGSIRVAGMDPRRLPLLAPDYMAYIPQDVALTFGTVRENVALGLPQSEIDDDMVWRALARSHLDSFIRASSDGLATVIGERGVRLSGGQRQRLGLARALYCQPKFLVLDEATSALDAGTEFLVSETIRSLEGEVTTVTVAHRLATVQQATSVAYMEEGKLLAVGSFAEVRHQVAEFDRQANLLGL